MRTDGSLLPSGAGRCDASRCVLGTRLAGQPRNRSPSSPRQRTLSDVPDGHSGPKETHWGGAFSRGVGAATARWTSRARKTLGDARGRAAGSRPHDASRRAPAGADVVVVPPARRDGVSRKSTARVSPPATAAPSPLLLPGWLSGGLRSTRSRCPHHVAVGVGSSPANIGSSFRGKPGLRADRSRGPDHRRRDRSRNWLAGAGLVSVPARERNQGSWPQRSRRRTARTRGWPRCWRGPGTRAI